jgi:hypothetical protein
MNALESDVTVDVRCHLFNDCDEHGIHTIREAYDLRRLLATSTSADTYLIRSHIAFHCGRIAAEESKITPSRGHTYRVKNPCWDDCIVRITDHYDHRDGVHGIV